MKQEIEVKLGETYLCRNGNVVYVARTLVKDGVVSYDKWEFSVTIIKNNSKLPRYSDTFDVTKKGRFWEVDDDHSDDLVLLINKEENPEYFL